MTEQTLLDSFKSQFTLDIECLEFGDKSFQFYYCSDDDQLMTLSDEVNSNDASAQPYWGQIWESSIGLCRWLKDEVVKGKTVLDLGCGAGIVGACAAAREANVVMVDAVPSAIELAALNSWHWRDRVQCKVINWNDDRLDQKFDYILGADIVYDRDDWQSLRQFWNDHLAIGGKVVLVEPTRPTGYEFAEWISKQDWQLGSEKLGLENDIPLQKFVLTPNG